MAATTKEQISQVVEPVVTGSGYELADVEWRREGGGWVLRLFIDHPPGNPEKVGLDDCTKVSREVSATLDVHEVINVPFTLEVSSPGLDRPLRKPDHFRRFVDKKARATLKTGIEGRRNFTGKILGVSDDGALVRFETEDGKLFDLPVADLEKANLKYEI